VRGYFKVDNELHSRPCVRTAKRDPLTRQVASLWTAVLSLAKEANAGGRLEHDGGPYDADDLAERAGLVVPVECVTRDASVTLRDVTLACVTLCVTWDWAEWDGDVLTVCAWGEWNAEDEAKINRNRAFSRSRSREYRMRIKSECHGTVTRDVTRDKRDVTLPEPDPEPEPDLKKHAAAPEQVSAPPVPPADPKPARSPKPKPALPDWLPAEPWAGFVDHRRRLRKPLTDRAVVLILGKLDRWRAAGHDPGALLDECVERGWVSPVDPADRYGAPGNGRGNGTDSRGQGDTPDPPRRTGILAPPGYEDPVDRPRKPPPETYDAYLERMGKGRPPTEDALGTR